MNGGGEVFAEAGGRQAQPPCPCGQWIRAEELGIRVGQHLEELLQLYHYLPPKIERVLEIGVSQGGWLFMLASAIRPPAHICGVDPVRTPQFDIVEQELRKLGHEVLLIQTSSEQALTRVRRWLGSEKLDVLHLDGRHTFEGVSQDWDSYRPLVRSGGVVVIHDVAPEDSANLGAEHFFRGLQRTHDTHLCRQKWQRGLGIGVVHIP